MGGPLEYASEADRLVLSRLHSKGEAWVVGGWVRESVSGAPSTDMDIATTLLPLEVKELFPLSLMYGAEYGTVVVRLEEFDETWEVTTLRSEGGYGDGRRPDKVDFGVHINDDLSRRDFTINAMAYDSERSLVDPFDGYSDLEDGILRSVGNAAERIGEDGLRVMRAYRFLASQKVVTMDSELRDAVRANIGMLGMVSKERIGDEMGRTIVAPKASTAISMMHDDGVIQQILPGLTSNPQVALSGDPVVNLALFCSADKRSGVDLVALLRESLRLSTDELREIAFLHEARDVSLPSTITEMRVFRAYLPELRQTRIIDYFSGLGRDVSQFESSINRLSPLKAGNAPLVDGNTLSEATGLEPGPRMGRLKGLLHRILVERDLSEQNDVLALLDELEWNDSEHEDWAALKWP